ncbi:antimicrobial peptide NK-lysin-like [Archocentrus centrarchus]|uniref:antimicrobial peptide NK-lysin-like n=1 Tax=Archocentrus centrarchus TaxID=63155 RepID=UPI0011E9BCD9|nr:antimicrobial peptide NK-lysin-like [Archocentrus centrarchus]
MLRHHHSLAAMEMSSFFFLCLVAACSVRAVHGRTLEVSIDDEEDLDVEVSMDASGLPGKCWACKWILNKVKKLAGPNATAESLSSKLSSICDEIGLLKSVCRKFVKVHLGELIEELTTTDDVRTICVNMGACKPKEVDLFFYPTKGDSRIEIKEFH